MRLSSLKHISNLQLQNQRLCINCNKQYGTPVMFFGDEFCNIFLTFNTIVILDLDLTISFVAD